jgi:cytochrome c-type biogenesis protein CcmF
VVLLVVALLIALFVARRYDIKYVYDYSSSDLEFRFRVASLWAGQPGSFVIWALWGLIAAQLLVRRTRHAEPYVLSVFMLIQAGLLFFMLIINPFAPYLDQNGMPLAPADGKGLNELLHNPWMIRATTRMHRRSPMGGSAWSAASTPPRFRRSGSSWRCC